jgi:Fe-S-cluster containining protein
VGVVAEASDGELAAGSFASWLTTLKAAIDGRGTSEVPCGGCTACCTSSQFIEIGPEEADTLTHIPAELLFPAPRRGRGHFVLGYDTEGRCPMLVDNVCSIYAHRPRACRTYDCRVFAAAGLEPDDAHGRIAERARQWRFSFPAEDDQIGFDSVGIAARYLAGAESALAASDAPANATQQAVLAVELSDLFVRRDERGNQTLTVPAAEDIRAAVARRIKRSAG